jgi:hypothetical protein
MTNVPYVACGVFSLTLAAEFPLHTVCRLHRIASAQLLYQPGEFQQIRHAEERTLLADDDLRVRSNEIRPLRWNRADGSIIDAQQETSSITVVPLAHASELFAAEWMEWVRDAHKTRRCDRSACTLD